MVEDTTGAMAAKKDAAVQSAQHLGESIKGGGEDIRAGFELAWTALREAFASASDRVTTPRRGD